MSLCSGNHWLDRTCENDTFQKRHSIRLLTSRAERVACLLVALIVVLPAAQGENWPGWRGPRGDGTSLETSVPHHWNGATGENLIWKTPLSGSGHASPIVWDDRVFIVGCIEVSQERILCCLDRRTGKTLWQ